VQPPFPARPGDAWETPPRLAARGFHLRPLRNDDEPWLRELYASTRADELASVPWTVAMRRAFCDQQFDLQHRHFVGYHGDADFLAIEHRGGEPAGRLYLDRSGEEDLVVDIALFPAFRGGGIGTVLLTAILDEATARARAVALHVAHHNPAARRLYERLGFVPVTSSPSHLLMRWRAPVDVS
jgi:GNAT superfamily N-acetyltransferase